MVGTVCIIYITIGINGLESSCLEIVTSVIVSMRLGRSFQNERYSRDGAGDAQTLSVCTVRPEDQL